MKRTVMLLILVAVACSNVYVFTPVFSQPNFERVFMLFDGETTYRLTLSITHELHEYYQQKDHFLTQDGYAAFVTPYSLALVAADIRSILAGEEDFVNAVLMFVHQIPYEIVVGVEYPVETLVNSRGDCDLLSFIAASLIKAEGLDVVLFYYEGESHMNIGVSLSQPPVNVRGSVSSVSYQGTTYYVAECTGGSWRTGWRVGECPPELEDAQVSAISLENCETIAPGQVSSSFNSLYASEITLSTSNFILEGSSVTISGQILSSNLTGSVILYVQTFSGEWYALDSVAPDSTGHYSFTWQPGSWGFYKIRTSWTGNIQYAGADSSIQSIYVLPMFLIFVAAGIIIAVVIAVIMALVRRTEQQEVYEYEY